MVDDGLYHADASLRGKLRRRWVRAYARCPAVRAPDAPMVSFSFDDAPATAARAGARVLEARGVRGTFYLCAGLAGRTDGLGPYATEADMRRLAAAGHEVGCHTFSHLDCGRADEATIAADIARNAEALGALAVGVLGVQATSTFAYPYGDVSASAKRVTRRRFSLARALHPGVVTRGVDLNQAPAVGIEGEGGEAAAHHWITRARAERAWLILYTHGVEAQATPYGCSTPALDGLVDRALGEGFEIVTVAEGAKRLGAYG